MDFSSWLALQRHDIGSLRVAPGTLVLSYSERHHRYSVARQPDRAKAPRHVEVTNRGATRARVVLWTREYTYVPAWVIGLGLDARAVGISDAEAKIAARLSFRKTAEEEYERLCGLARDASEEDWATVLEWLTRQERTLESALRDSLAAALTARDDLAELTSAPFAASCVVCGRSYAAWEQAPVFVCGSTLACGECLPGRRAA